MDTQGWRTALFFNQAENNRVHCGLCPHGCVIPEGQVGKCLVRRNSGGVLFTTIWGRPGAMTIDPIEKMPLFHFHPQTDTFAIGTAGCNLDCSFCHVHELAHSMPTDLEQIEMTPEKIVYAAQANKCRSISFTFNEPTVCAEYMMNVSETAARGDLKSVAVTNGFITRSAIREVFRHVGAVSVELKGFDPTFYREQCHGTLTDVLHSIVEMAELGIHVEITTPIIPGMNDSARSIRTEASWIRDSLGMDTPLHLTAFTPAYRLAHVQKTPVALIENLAQVAMGENLRYVYAGGVKSALNNTKCHKCGKVVVERDGFHVKSLKLVSGNLCPACGAHLPFIRE